MICGGVVLYLMVIVMMVWVIGVCGGDVVIGDGLYEVVDLDE